MTLKGRKQKYGSSYLSQRKKLRNGEDYDAFPMKRTNSSKNLKKNFFGKKIKSSINDDDFRDDHDHDYPKMRVSTSIVKKIVLVPTKGLLKKPISSTV